MVPHVVRNAPDSTPAAARQFNQNFRKENSVSPRATPTRTGGGGVGFSRARGSATGDNAHLPFSLRTRIHCTLAFRTVVYSPRHDDIGRLFHLLDTGFLAIRARILMHRAMNAVTGRAWLDPPWQFATEREVATLVLQPTGFDKDTHHKLDVLRWGDYLVREGSWLSMKRMAPSPIGLRAIMVGGR